MLVRRGSGLFLKKFVLLSLLVLALALLRMLQCIVLLLLSLLRLLVLVFLVIPSSPLWDSTIRINLYFLIILYKLV